VLAALSSTPPAAAADWHALFLLNMQLLQVQLTPDLESPAYSVLKATREYELRRYQPFIVAETAMPRGSSEYVETASCRLARANRVHVAWETAASMACLGFVHVHLHAL
jgi:hypothetical protein